MQFGGAQVWHNLKEFWLRQGVMFSICTFHNHTDFNMILFFLVSNMTYFHSKCVTRTFSQVVS